MESRNGIRYNYFKNLVQRNLESWPDEAASATIHVGQYEKCDRNQILRVLHNRKDLEVKPMINYNALDDRDRALDMIVEEESDDDVMGCDGSR